MKRYANALLPVIGQIALFYLFPLCAKPLGAIAAVVLMLAGTLIPAGLIGWLIKSPLRFAWPPAVALLFLPTIPLYYNHTALIHALLYFVLAFAGVGMGALLRLLADKIAVSR